MNCNNLSIFPVDAASDATEPTYGQDREDYAGDDQVQFVHGKAGKSLGLSNCL